VDSAAFDAALADQVDREKEVTRLGDRTSAARRRLPMVEVENYTFEGPDGPVTLVDLFQGRYLLVVQNVMSTPRGTRAVRAARGRSTTCPTTWAG
jgi:predicted dithiol-disulfide oxidoreductase (DUF899 family)